MHYGQPTIVSDSRRAMLRGIWALVAILSPAVATFGYPMLRFIPTLPWGYRSAVAPAFYGSCVALTATLFEFKRQRRIICCVVAAVLSTLGQHTLDIFLILYVAILTGFVAVGAPQTSVLYNSSNRSIRLVVQVVYGTVRAFIAFALAVGAILVAEMVLPRNGRDPAGGGDITLDFGKFTCITYAFVLAFPVFDRLACRHMASPLRPSSIES
jgi:hypothetical protein